LKYLSLKSARLDYVQRLKALETGVCFLSKMRGKTLEDC
jgi:hypothetical protein